MDMHEKENIRWGGQPLKEAKKALVLLHGRGGTAEDILSLATFLNVEDFVWVAPQAAHNTWYPYSFMVKPQENEPWLSSALDLLGEIMADIADGGIPHEQVYFSGFSQGACLMLEFLARNAKRYGGAAAFTGGLIGDEIHKEHYQGDFQGTPIYIGSSDPDPHVPVVRVHESVAILEALKASVKLRIYPNMGHTITQTAIVDATLHVFDAGGSAFDRH